MQYTEDKGPSSTANDRVRQWDSKIDADEDLLLYRRQNMNAADFAHAVRKYQALHDSSWKMMSHQKSDAHITPNHPEARYDMIHISSTFAVRVYKCVP